MTGDPSTLLVPNDPDLLGQILRQYKPNVRYLKSAEIAADNGLVTGKGTFGIDGSCYCSSDSGHLNSVELNICYNQLMYYVLAASVKHRMMAGLPPWTMLDYWERQGSVLIVEFFCRFRRLIDPRAFSGCIEFVKVEKHKLKVEMILANTLFRFSNLSDERAALGKIKLAIPVAVTSGTIIAS